MIRDDGGGARRFLVQVQDVTHRRRYEENLQYLATHDPLTGLHNRSSFAEPARHPRRPRAPLRRRGRAAAARPRPLQVRQRHARPPGRRPASSRASRSVLARRLRETDVLARLGGDEFAVLLPQGRPRRRASASPRTCSTALRAERIAVPRHERPHDHGEHRRRDVRARRGPERRGRARQRRPRDVRRQGGGAQPGRRCTSAGEHAQARMQGRVTWAERIRVAIDEERFALVAQPILDLETGVVTQFEVLLRMLDDDGDLIPPGAFLSTAERLGMIQEIDAIVVARAIRAVAAAGRRDRRHRASRSTCPAASMGDPAILRVIERELRETGLDPARVIFEITETAAIANIAKAREFADELAKLGCRFALDDFGAGFGSFYYLKHVHFDILKIDGEFVRDCVRHAHRPARHPVRRRDRARPRQADGRRARRRRADRRAAARARRRLRPGLLPRQAAPARQLPGRAGRRQRRARAGLTRPGVLDGVSRVQDAAGNADSRCYGRLGTWRLRAADILSSAARRQVARTWPVALRGCTPTVAPARAGVADMRRQRRLA